MRGVGYRRMERGSMQLLWVTKRTVTTLLAMIVMAGVVAIEGAQAGRTLTSTFDATAATR